MTDQEIHDALTTCNDLLSRYRTIALMVAEELAARKSLAVYGEPGHYNGDLGCYESGMNTLCLHSRNSNVPDEIADTAREFDQQMRDQFIGDVQPSGRQLVWIDGFD